MQSFFMPHQKDASGAWWRRPIARALLAMVLVGGALAPVLGDGLGGHGAAVPAARANGSEAWSMQGHDGQRTGRSSLPGPTSLAQKWVVELNSFIKDNVSPVVGPDGTIYASSGAGMIAVNPNGTVKWTKAGTFVNDRAPALSPDGAALYVFATGAPPQPLVALDTANGDILWAFTEIVGVMSYSSLAVGSDGAVYFGTQIPPAIYSVNPTGTLRWRYNSPSPCGIEAPPAVTPNGLVYIVHNCVGLVALNQSGQLRWTWNDNLAGWHISDYGWPTPTIGPDGTVYVAGGGGPLVYAFNPDGSVKWKRHGIAGNWFPGLALSADAQTLFRFAAGRVHALHAQTGATRWMRQLFTAASDGTIDNFAGSPVLASNGILYVMSDWPTIVGGQNHGNGKVHAVSAVTGQLLGTFELNNYPVYWGPQSPALGTDATLYVLSSYQIAPTSVGNSRLYALTTDANAAPPPTLPTTDVGITVQRTGTAGGGDARFRVTVTNFGPGVANAVKFEFRVTARTYRRAFPVADGGICTPNDGEAIVCTLGAMQPAQARSISFDVVSAFEPSVPVEATVFGDFHDPRATNTYATASSSDSPDTGQPVDCAVERRVNVAAAAAGGRLGVTVTVRELANQLVSILYGTGNRPLVNALIDLSDGRTGLTNGFVWTLPPGATRADFWVRRQNDGQATTVPLVITDRCGPWETFVGGGPGAF